MKFTPSRFHRNRKDFDKTTDYFQQRTQCSGSSSCPRLSGGREPTRPFQTLSNQNQGSHLKTSDPRMIPGHLRSSALQPTSSQKNLINSSNGPQLIGVVDILDQLIHQEDQFRQNIFPGVGQSLEVSPHQLVMHSHCYFPEELNPSTVCETTHNSFRSVGYLEKIGFGYHIIETKVIFWCAAARLRHLFVANEEAHPKEDQAMPTTQYTQHVLDHQLTQIKLIDYPRTQVDDTSNSSAMLILAPHKIYLYKYVVSQDGCEITSMSPQYLFDLGGLDIVKALSIKNSEKLRIFYMEAGRDEVKEAGVSQRLPFYVFRKRMEPTIKKQGLIKSALETGKAVWTLVLNKSIRVFSRQEKTICSMIADEEKCLIFSHIQKFYSNNDVEDVVTMYGYDKQSHKRLNSFTSGHLLPYLKKDENPKIAYIAPAQSFCKSSNLVIRLQIGTLLFVKVHPNDSKTPIQVITKLHLANPALFKEPKDSRWIAKVALQKTNILEYDQNNDEFIELGKSYPQRNIQVLTARWKNYELGILNGIYPLDPTCLYFKQTAGLQGKSSVSGKHPEIRSSDSTSIQQIDIPPTTYILIGNKGYCLMSRLRPKDQAFSSVFHKNYSSSLIETNSDDTLVGRICLDRVERVVSLLDIFLRQGPRYFFFGGNMQHNQYNRHLTQFFRNKTAPCVLSERFYYMDVSKMSEQFFLRINETLDQLCKFYEQHQLQFLNGAIANLVKTKGLKIAGVHIYLSRLLRPIFQRTLSQVYAFYPYFARKLKSIPKAKLKALFLTLDLQSPDNESLMSLQIFLRRCLQLLELLDSLAQEHSIDLLPDILFSKCIKSPSELEDFFFSLATASAGEHLIEWERRFPQFMRNEFVEELRIYYELRKLGIQQLERKLKVIQFSQRVSIKTVRALRDLYPDSIFLNRMSTHQRTDLSSQEDSLRKYYRLIVEKEQALDIKEKVSRLLEALDILEKFRTAKRYLQKDYFEKKQELKKLKTQVFILQELQKARIDQNEYFQLFEQANKKIILEVAEKTLKWTQNPLVPLIAFLNLGRQGDCLTKIEKFTDMAVEKIRRKVNPEAYEVEIDKCLEVLSELVPKDASDIQQNVDTFLLKLVALVASLFQENEENRGGYNTKANRYNLCDRLSRVFGAETVIRAYENLCRELSKCNETALLEKLFYEQVEPVLERLGEKWTLKLGHFKILLEVRNNLVTEISKQTHPIVQSVKNSPRSSRALEKGDR